MMVNSTCVFCASPFVSLLVCSYVRTTVLFGYSFCMTDLYKIKDRSGNLPAERETAS